MLLHQLLSADAPVAAPSDSVEYISSLFFASKLCQIPVVEDGNYLGIIDEKDIQTLETAREEMTNRDYEKFRPALLLSAHPFEVLRIMHIHQLSLLPIINDENEYVGAITKDALLKYLVENMGVEAEGSIIVLEMAPRDYSLSQIARICESEQVLILGVSIKTNVNTGKLELTIKTNTTDIAAVVQSLERFQYTVLDTYGDQKIDNDIVDRYKLFMNYINM